MNFPVRSSDISTPHERLEECDRFEKIYKGYDAYHSQVRKLDWLKSHHAYTASPEVSKHAEWLIETLYAIVARWEEVLPYIAEPYPIPPNSPSAFSFNATPEPPSGRESLGVLLEGLEGRGRAMMGQPFVNNADVLAEIDLPGFGTRRVLKVFKLFEVQQLALHSCFIRNLMLGLDKLETACRQHGVISTGGGSGCVADMLVDVEGDVVLGLTPPAMEGIDGPFDMRKSAKP
ncbi:hypothetical protein AALT_g9332 [Alternaria alternata]|nr:hypothetical protein AALT_g9332 [Alternaria alternata]